MGDAAGYPNPVKAAIFLFFSFCFISLLIQFFFRHFYGEPNFYLSGCVSLYGKEDNASVPGRRGQQGQGERPESRPCQLKNALAANNLIWCVSVLCLIL